MASLPTYPQQHFFSEQGAGSHRLPRVAIFRSGSHRGKEYTDRDLVKMVENWQANKSALHVPCVIGHDEKQEFLQRSDLPAAGWVIGLKKEGPILYAELGHLPPQVMRLLESKAYRTVSAEVYDEPPEGISGKGKMLRRVAFLGGDIPQIKSLGEIPITEAHSERFAAPSYSLLRFRHALPGKAPNDAWTVFSEVQGQSEMDRQAIIDALAQHGCDTSQVTDAVPDAVLAEWLRACDDKDDSKHDAYLEDVENERVPDWPEPADEEDVQKLRERARKYYEHARKYYERFGCAKMSGDDGGGGTTDDIDATSVTRRPEEPAAMKMSELKAIIASVIDSRTNEALTTLTKFKEEQLHSGKKATVDALIEQLSREGRLPPAEREAERQGLMMADTSTLHKFSEGTRTVERSAFDHRVKQLKSRPCAFGSRFADPAKNRGGNRTAAATTFAENDADEDHDGELSKVADHYEAFSEHFESVGGNRESILAGFKAARKHNKRLTAAEYLDG